MTTSSCLVTAYFTIPSKRPPEFYFKNIERFLRSCATPCIFFTDPALVPAFEAYKNPNIQLVPFAFNDLEAWKFGQEFWKIQKERDSEKYHTAELGAIWYEKPHFVLRASEKHTASVYIWIDAGCIRSDAEEIAFREFGTRTSPKPLYDDRIHLQMLQKLPTKPFYSHPDVSIAGAIIAGTLSAWKKHIELYDIVLKQYDKAKVSCISDQYIIKSCVQACPGIYVCHEVPFITHVDRWFWFLEKL